MARRLSLALAMLGTGATLLVGSALSARAAETPQGGTLRIGAANVDFVDPALGYWRDAWLIQDATCARLFANRYDPRAGAWRVTPEVVDRYTVSRDGRVYVLTLKKTFRFHTGAPVTAQSFADALDRNARLRSPRSPAAVYMREIVGAAAVSEDEARSISGVRVLDRERLQIRLTQPMGDFTARLTMPFFCPIAPGTPVDRATDTPAGSGPYYIAEHVRNQRIVLRRNPFYRGGRPANVDQMVWTTGESVEACLLAVEEDRADLCGQPGAPRDSWRPLAGKYGINRPNGRLFVGPSLATWALAFNHARPAFRGPGQIALKKAINFAIDRPAMVRPFGYLAGKRTDQMLPPALARPSGIYPLGGADVGAARLWYARARLRPTTLVFYTSALPQHVALAEVLEFNLRQIGIDLEVRYFSLASLAEKAATPGEPFDLALLGWGVDYVDAASVMVPLLGRGAINAGINLADPRLQRRIEAANRLTGEARRQAWADLDIELMRNDPPWAPIVHVQNRTLVSRSVGCFAHHPVVTFDLTALCKKP